MTKRSSRPIWLGEDHRGWDHVRIHIQLFKDARLNANDLVVYGGLACHAELDTGAAHPSAATLASYGDISERTVFRSLIKLRKLGYIETTASPGKASIYRLLPPPRLFHTHDSLSGVQDQTPDRERARPLTEVPRTPDSVADELEPRTRDKNHSSRKRTTTKTRDLILNDGSVIQQHLIDGQWQEVAS